jgi:hypothetical protein
MAKVTTKQKEVLSKAFDNCLNNTVNHLLEYKKALLETVDEHDLKCSDLDFKDLAISGFLMHLKKIEEHYSTMRSLKKEINDILGNE